MKLRDILNEIQSFWIRDTLVKKDVFDNLSDEVQDKILKLKRQFDSLGYIDARTQLGPDQIRRQSDKQRNTLSNTALKVFDIEQEVKELLKSSEQKQTELDATTRKKLQDRKLQLTRQITDLERIYALKLASPRENPAKRAYKLATDELKDVEFKLSGQ